MNCTRVILLIFLCSIYVPANADFTGLSYEYTGFDNVEGFVTLRVYANFDQPTDQLTSIFGNNLAPLSATCSGTFFQSFVGGGISTTINPIFYTFFPELVYDSWMTIGLEDQVGNVMTTSGLDFTIFEGGGDFVENDVAGGQLICPAGAVQNFPIAGKVLIAQFTVNGDLDLLLNLVWRDGASTIHQSTGISLHIEGGDPGCDDPFALNFDPAATLNDGSCAYPAPSFSGLSFETIAYNVIPGFHTHRVYAEFGYAGDQLTALFGQDNSPLTIVTTGSFYQDGLGGPLAVDINPGLFPVFPSLEFDSWLTIGTGPGPGSVDIIGMNTTPFESGDALQISDEYGGAWYILPGTEPAAFPDINGKVLIAQLTSDGTIAMSLNLQYRAANGNDPQVWNQSLTIPFLLAGCMNPEACNYNSSAEAEDGTCILPEIFYEDIDDDGFGNPAAFVPLCAIQPGYVANDLDCDDARNDVFPGAAGTQEGIDNNCNGSIDPDEQILDSCPGDFTGDGEINTSDLLLFLGNLGCTSGCEIFDLTGDNVVNTGDMLIFLGYFGTSCL